jgi:hypothetical protein
VREAGLCYPPCEPGYEGVGNNCFLDESGTGVFFGTRAHCQCDAKAAFRAQLRRRVERSGDLVGNSTGSITSLRAEIKARTARVEGRTGDLTLVVPHDLQKCL